MATLSLSRPRIWTSVTTKQSPAFSRGVVGRANPLTGQELERAGRDPDRGERWRRAGLPKGKCIAGPVPEQAGVGDETPSTSRAWGIFLSDRR
jgi:hypothetical protein